MVADEQTLIELAPSLSLSAAESLLSEFNSKRGFDLTVDASKVERIGGVCVQIILSAVKTWRDEGRAFIIETPSDAFCQSVSGFGLNAEDFDQQEAFPCH